jgi:hypothetical protein
MIGETAPFALFDDKSVSAMSAPFRLLPGHVAEFSAFNFSQFLVQPDADRARVYQGACLHQIHYTSKPLPEYVPCSGVIPDFSQLGKILVEGPVFVNGCHWSLDACNTLRRLDLPGVYRFILNDPVAAGVVQIYMRVYTTGEITSGNSTVYFGE